MPTHTPAAACVENTGSDGPQTVQRWSIARGLTLETEVAAMGFDVFLQSFNASETEGIPLDEFIAIFGDALSKSKDRGYDLKYGRRSRCYLSVTASRADDQLIIGMSVCRPIPDIRLWNSLFEILRVAPMCLYYPGDGPPLVAQPSLVRRKSPIFADLGRPKVVRSGEEIRDAIVNDGKE